MKNVRAALIGAGDWGERHLQALKSVERVELVAVCDANPKRAKEMGEKYSVERVYTDYGEMFEREKPEMVDVCTPEQLHREPVTRAAELGIHVNVEKPLATTLEDADAMIRAAEKNHVFLQVGHILRWDARYAMLKESLDRGELGEIGAILARRVNRRSDGARLLNRVSILSQLAIHDIDLVLWYTKQRVRRCFAGTTNVLKFANPDISSCMLNFQNGTQAVLEHSFTLPDSVPFWVGARMEIVTSTSFVVVDSSEQCLFIGDQQGWKTPDTTLFPVVRGRQTGALRDELDYFARCVQDGREPSVVRPEEARYAVEVALACQESVRTGRPVELGV